MKKVIFLLSAVIAFSALKGQKAEISGQIRDAQNKEPLEFCSVSVFNSNDSLITGTVTNQKGYYGIDLLPGSYKFVFSFIGYVPDTTPLISVTQKKFLGVASLKPDVSQLKEVNVKSSATEVQLDRETHIVNEKLKEGASTTKDVLGRVNGVTYDRYNNSIKVDNDSKVIILVDGIEKDQEYVKNISPERLKKIEIIRDPGGRYGLEGYSAVINIILKKDYRGQELFISERLMIDPDAGEKSNIPVQNGSSLTLNYVYNKVNAYVKASNNVNNFNLQSRIDKQYGDSVLITSGPEDEENMNLMVKQMYNSCTAGADIFINPKHTLSAEAGFTGQPYSFDNTVQEDSVAVLLSGVNAGSYFTTSESKTGSSTVYGMLHYETKPDENNTITTNFTFSRNNSRYMNLFSEPGVFQRLEEGNSEKMSTKFYLEYTRALNSKNNVQAGYGNTWYDNRSLYFTEGQERTFGYSDLRNKLYAYYSWQPSKKFGVKTGSAMETSRPVSGGNKFSYLSLNPYCDIKYKPNEVINIKAKYRVSTRYPDVSETSPFTNTVDLQSVKTGNPLLEPEVAHKVSLQFSLLEGLLSVEPYYHYSGNMIAETGKMRSDGIFEYGYGNLGVYNNKGVEAHLTIPFGKSLFLQTDADYYQSSVEYSGRKHSLDDLAFTGQLIYYRQKDNFVAGLQYQNNLRKFITAQGYQKGDNDFWILFVQKPFLKQRLTVMMLYFLPVNFGCDFNQGGYISSGGYSETKNYDISLLKNMLMFEVSYRFSKGKTVTKLEKKDDEENGKKPKKLF